MASKRRKKIVSEAGPVLNGQTVMPPHGSVRDWSAIAVPVAAVSSGTGPEILYFECYLKEDVASNVWIAHCEGRSKGEEMRPIKAQYLLVRKELKLA